MCLSFCLVWWQLSHVESFLCRVDTLAPAEGKASSPLQVHQLSGLRLQGFGSQVEGAFIQGLGLFTSEEVITDSDSGRLITDGTWEYKIPAATCIPRQFNATFLKVPCLSCAEALPVLPCTGSLASAAYDV